MTTPAEHFGLKIIGKVTTKQISVFAPRTYDVIKIVDWGPAGKAYITNVWYREHMREPLAIAQQLGARYEQITPRAPAPGPAPAPRRSIQGVKAGASGEQPAPGPARAPVPPRPELKPKKGGKQ
jgi:hypothetical protein